MKRTFQGAAPCPKAAREAGAADATAASVLDGAERAL